MQKLVMKVLVVTVALAAVVGWLPGQVAAQASTANADTVLSANESLVRRFFEIASRGDLDDLASLVAPDFVIQTAPPGEGPGLETLTQTFQTARAGLPDFAIQIDDLFSQGNMVVSRTTISGTHLGDFFGTPPTGKQIEVAAIDIWRVEDGKLAENWHLEDILGVMQQLGVVPGETSTPVAADSATAPMPTSDETSAAMPDAATIVSNMALAQRFQVEIFEQGHLEVADELLAPGFVWHSDVPPGAAGVKTFASTVRAAFPDITMTADLIVAAGDRVAILWTLSGTHEGEFLGAPATGTGVSTPGVDIYRIEDGKIAEIWTVGDDLGLLMQLGAIPSFGGDAAATPGAN